MEEAVVQNPPLDHYRQLEGERVSEHIKHVSTDFEIIFLQLEPLKAVMVISWNQQRLFELENLRLVGSKNDFF